MYTHTYIYRDRQICNNNSEKKTMHLNNGESYIAGFGGKILGK